MSAVSEFVIDMDVVQEEEVYQVYLLARANKRKSEDAVIFEINQERNIPRQRELYLHFIATTAKRGVRLRAGGEISAMVLYHKNSRRIREGSDKTDF